ncbi:MAG: hypothetical protein U1E56_04920 [Bauldia sp.]
MRKQLALYGALASGLVALTMVTSPAWAVRTQVGRYFYDLPKDALTTNEAAVRTLIEVSDAIGFTRNQPLPGNPPAGGPANCLGCLTPMFELKGSGMYNGVSNADVVITFDRRKPGVRADVTAAGGKARTVTVALDKVSWDETTPGVGAKASTETSLTRLLPIFLLPSEVVYSGIAAADKIKLTSSGSLRTLTIPVPLYNTNLIATIDRSGFPVKTEMTVGGKIYTGEYDEFDNDRMDNHVFMPSRIVQKMDGKVFTDLSLDYTWTNPYMVFQIPKEIASK